IERYEKGWAYELLSLGPEKVSLTSDTGWVWKPPALEAARALDDEKAPALTSAARQRQARTISRRFGASGFAGGRTERLELRLQPHPIHQYQDGDNGLLDGVFFVFSNGTNPEVLLIVEAVTDTTDKTDAGHWQYALARLSTGTLEATLDGKKVWQMEW